MRLRSLSYKEDYRSGQDDILMDVLRPSLQRSSEYWRAVGYFSSSALEALGTPLAEFIANGGSIRLVTSVELGENDIEALSQGVSQELLCHERLLDILENEFADGVGDGVNRLGRLLELDRLEIRIAMPKSGTGIYHEKIGVFLDKDDYVAFSGSANESMSAFEHNRECIDVFTSWSDPSRAERKRQHFEEVWTGTDPGVNVYTFPEAAKRKLIRIARHATGRSVRTGAATVRASENIWRHQDEALRIFLEEERGILNMATGTGKTRTALRIATALFQQDLIDTLIIAMDGNDLLRQWYKELLTEWEPPTENFPFFRHYETIKELQEFSLVPTNRALLVSRAHSPSGNALGSALRSLTPDQGTRTLLIHDEVHRLGSPQNRKQLAGRSDHIRFRLGLSATPEREYDEEGTQFIVDHVGPELMRFELEDAIRRGILSPFNYHALRYELGPEDREKIQAVFRRRAARKTSGNPMSDEEFWIELARVQKTSKEKLPVFRDYISQNPELLERSIIFVETEEYGRDVLDIVHKFRPDFHTYFSGEDSATLQRFAKGELRCLLTCHRLSEGIDIRSLNTVILFSSARAKLETIQRIGRCLRRDPDNPRKVANVIDFVRETNPASESDFGEENFPSADVERFEWLSVLSEIRPEGWTADAD